MSRDRRPSPQALRLLAALLGEPQEWRHGYELSQGTGLKAGTLYPLLMRLSQRGFLDSRWEDAPRRGRPPRHAYRLSAEGLSFAQSQVPEIAGAAAHGEPA